MLRPYKTYFRVFRGGPSGMADKQSFWTVCPDLQKVSKLPGLAFPWKKSSNKNAGIEIAFLGSKKLNY